MLIDANELQSGRALRRRRRHNAAGHRTAHLRKQWLRKQYSRGQQERECCYDHRIG
jgi:hypothetical protein